MALSVQLDTRMAEILTRQFGPLDYEESAVVEFPSGLPGFESHRRFVLIERPALAPLVFLQSLSGELCFPSAPVKAIDPNYELAMTPEDAHLLGCQEFSALVCLAIVTAPEDGPLTANLLAPVVIDSRTRRGVQAVRMDSRYSHRHAVGETPCS